MHLLLHLLLRHGGGGLRGHSRELRDGLLRLIIHPRIRVCLVIDGVCRLRWLHLQTRGLVEVMGEARTWKDRVQGSVRGLQAILRRRRRAGHVIHQLRMKRVVVQGTELGVLMGVLMVGWQHGGGVGLTWRT